MLNRILLKERTWAPRIDHLWLIVILAGAIFITSLVPLPPNDFWWHLKIGEIIVETGKIPETNIFGWTLEAAHPFTYGAWLGEALLYLLYRWGGLELVTFTRTVLQAITCMIVGLVANRRSGSWRIASLVVILGFAMTTNNLIVRPQMWSWVPFALYLLLLDRYAVNQLNPKWLLMCPFIMVFWVNAHGAFVLGGVLLGIYFAGEVLKQLLNPSALRTWRKARWLFIISLLTLFAMMVNPQGPGIVGYVVNLMTDQPSQKLIVEWQSPTPDGIANTVFFISIVLLIVAFWYLHKSPQIEDVFLLAGFLWLAWSGVRYVVWFGIVSMPVLAESAVLLLGEKARKVTRAGRRNLLNVIIAVIIFIPVLLVQPWFVEQAALPLPDKYWDLVLKNNGEGPFVSVETPVDAASFLQAHPGRKIYNEMGYGSYFIWAIPDMGVFVDPRVELYPYEQWQDYWKIMNGIRYNALLDQYGVERIVLDVELQENLAQCLPEDPGWERVFDNGRTEIWDKVGDVP